MRRIVVLVIVTLLLAASFASLLNIQPIQGSRSNNSKAGDAPSFDWIFVIFLDVNASLYQAHPGTMIHIYVGINVTWDVFDFSSFWVEALYNGSAIARKIIYLLGSGHDSFTLDFAWNTSGLEPGSYLISAATSTHVYYEDGYVRILQTLTVPDDYPTIQAAINNASDGDTIFVRNGTYHENVVVNKTLSLVGENREGAIIDGNGTGTAVTVLANDTRVTGFTIQNGGTGVEVENASRIELSQNNIFSNADGINVLYSEGITITDNIVIGRSTLIGVAIRGSNSCLVSRNEISDYWPILLVSSNHSTISDNLLFARGTYGIYLSFSGTYDNLIFGNSIFNASWAGIRARYGSSNNLIFHNNFLNNTVQAECSPGCLNVWDNGCEGNYWSDYNGTDSDGDGIGDILYVINENNTDPCPLMNPYWNIGDINHDSTVDIFDIVSAAGAYGSTPSSPKWNPHCDIAEPYGIINIFDLVTIAASYGEEYPP